MTSLHVAVKDFLSCCLREWNGEQPEERRGEERRVCLGLESEIVDREWSEEKCGHFNQSSKGLSNGIQPLVDEL